MKYIKYLILMILMLFTVNAAVNLDRESNYCLNNEGCSLDYLNVGNLSVWGSYLNTTVTNYNVTGNGNFLGNLSVHESLNMYGDILLNGNTLITNVAETQCSGTATSCDLLGASDCGTQQGCGWNDFAFPDPACEGSVVPCGTYNDDEFFCDAQIGCNWIDGSLINIYNSTIKNYFNSPCTGDDFVQGISDGGTFTCTSGDLFLLSLSGGYMSGDIDFQNTYDLTNVDDIFVNKIKLGVHATLNDWNDLTMWLYDDYVNLDGDNMTGNLNFINASINNVNYIDFNTTWSGTHNEGRLHWDDDDGTLEVGMKGGIVHLQIGQELLIRGKNDENFQIDNGKVIYISGGTGSQPLFKNAYYNETSALKSLAVATENIASSQFGYVTTNGLVRDLNTGSYSAGDELYLSTNGSFTNVKPSLPNSTIVVGYVIRSHTTEGVIYVNINERLNLSDATSPNCQDGFCNNITYLNYSNNGYLNISGGINNDENYLSIFDKFGAGHNVLEQGISSIVLMYGGCQFEDTPTEFICYAPYNYYDKKGTINLTGNTNLVVVKAGTSGNTRGIEIKGNANLVGGTMAVRNSSINGTGNIVWGTGGLDLADGTKGNINIGNQNKFLGTSEGSGAFGQLHTIDGNYCYSFGAQNYCTTSYGTALGYGNTVDGATGVAIGRYNSIGSSGTFSATLGYGNNITNQYQYVFGRNVDVEGLYKVVLGNGVTGVPNNDIVISEDNITINKEIMINNDMTFIGDINPTGSNQGNEICIDVNYQLCPCGQCA